MDPPTCDTGSGTPPGVGGPKCDSRGSLPANCLLLEYKSSTRLGCEVLPRQTAFYFS